MTTLPITRMTLYKHGVGFFERRATLEGDSVTLSFPVEAMNDILKSLTAVDWSDGQITGIDYATPQSREERLVGCSIRLDDGRSLRDLLISLRGRQVRLRLDQAETAEGVLIGLDELPERQPIAASLVSLLQDGEQTRAFTLGRVQGVDILDEQGAADLRFFLEVSLTQERQRQVTIRLTPGQHDLSVSYVAPAPVWRVSYRLLADPEKEEALLMGWGIFDNQLDEDLKNIALTLTAGMPISFVYDLYTPFTPERPEIKEEERVAPGPVDFAGAAAEAPSMPAPAAPPSPKMMRARKPMAKQLAQTTAVTASGEAKGALFQYRIQTPVSVGRGQSAMVPILSVTLPYRKELLYNGAKMPNHPVASFRLENKTGLTLERGPALVIEDGDYAGEAVLPFTAVDAEFVVPFTVELGVRVREQSGSRAEIHGLSLEKAYLLVEEWDIRWREYRLFNSTAEAMTVLVEQPRQTQYDCSTARNRPKPAKICTVLLSLFRPNRRKRCGLTAVACAAATKRSAANPTSNCSVTCKKG
ncbi:MAG TPA: hypothetical protein EYH05_08070 [Anaerolineae bacterium]|nr:hypothetical protein [Anaerolineae bacterium]